MAKKTVDNGIQLETSATYRILVQGHLEEEWSDRLALLEGHVRHPLPNMLHIITARRVFCTNFRHVLAALPGYTTAQNARPPKARHVSRT